MMEALPKIMKDKGFFGMMAAQAETTEGKLSNAEDAVFSLSASIGERLKPSVDKGISAFAKWVETTESWVKIPTAQKIAEEKLELNLLVGRLQDVNVKGEARKSLIEEIQRKYPDFLKNINLEKATTDQLTKALEEANIQYDKKIRLATLSAYKERTAKDRADALAEVGEKTVALLAKPEMIKGAYKVSKLMGEQYIPTTEQATTPGDKAFSTWYGKAEKLSKTNPELATAFYTYKAARDTYRENKSIWGTLEQQKKDAEANLKKYELQDQIVQGIIDKESGIVKQEPAEDGSATSGSKIQESDIIGGITGSSGGNSDLGTGRGGSGTGRNVTTTIQNLINGDIIIQTTNVTEGAEQIKRIVIEALVDATNEIN